MFFVYLIKNFVNGKLYVGKTNDIKIRWRQHKKIAAGGKAKYPKEYSYIHSAISKYGTENFKISILYRYDNENEALEDEIYHIARLKNEGYELYNLTDGGDGSSGYKFSEESKRKMSITHIGMRHTEESKCKMSLAQKGNTNNLGKKHSDETKKKMSEWQIGKTLSIETKKKISSAHLGMKASEATKQKMSLAKIGKSNKSSSGNF
jgi:group I intron endonuclease